MNAPAPNIGAQARMPRHSPLDMPAQDFRASARQMAVPVPPSWRTRAWRAVIFGTTGGAMFALMAAVGHWLAMGGLMATEVLLLALIGVTAIWILLSVATALAGLHALVTPPRPRAQPSETTPLTTALLIPIYNETPWAVFGNAAAMLEDLNERNPRGDFSLFILSDTTDDAIAAREWQALSALVARAPVRFPVYYRRRAQNTDRKIGNIRDWITGWGGAYDAMIVLDADSLMSGRAIANLADELTADPQAGLIQTCPRLIFADSFFGRLQQFSNAAYGFLLAEGLARWSGREGNYWGHNAIIRTRAFAAAAGLPHLRNWRGRKTMIWSHDFVEAALLRRAGWGVRFVTRQNGSFEETPATLIDHVLRDRRWCQGNLQHLRLLGIRGLHPISRFHLFHGAMSYLLSPAWFLLLVIWALLGTGAETSVIRYFSDANPLYPSWPEMGRAQSALFLGLMYGMLLAPKILGAGVILLSDRRRRAFGGIGRFVPSALVEIICAIAYAPVQMVQQTVAVLRIALGLRVGWTPQNRNGGTYSLGTIVKFHALETVSGVLLALGMFAGVVSLWLLPVAISLVMAVPLSAISRADLSYRRGLRALFATPETLAEPRVARAARQHRARFRNLDEDAAIRIAAE